MRTKCNVETTEVGLIYKLDGYEYWKSFQELEGDEVETVEQPLQEPLFTCNRIVPKKFKKPRKVPILWEHTFLRRRPQQLTCPNCLNYCLTVVTRRCSRRTHFFALILLPVGLCMLPYLTKEAKTSVHRCPECGVYLGACLGSVKEGLVFLCSPNHLQDFQD